jgi:hypothetical protein
MELQDIYLETRPEHIAYIKFIFESYEEVGMIRTVDRKKVLQYWSVASDRSFSLPHHSITPSLQCPGGCRPQQAVHALEFQ